MKKKYQYSIFILSLMTFLGCKKDIVKDQADNDFIYPRIFKETALFTATPTIINPGDTIKYTGILFSPAADVRVLWKVNDKEVANTPAYNFIGGDGGDYFVKLEVSYNGKVTSRTTEVLVNSSNYTKKPSSFIAMNYLTDAGSAANIDWNNVTHVTYKAGTVTAAGTLDVTKGEANNKALELVARGHSKGVPVLLGISGALSADGWSISGSNNFGVVITDPVKRAALVQTVKTYLAAKKMDGVDIMMTDINTTTAQINAATSAIKTFLDDLKTALPASSLVTVTAATNSYYTKYPDLSAADWVNIHAFEDGVHVGPGAALGQSSGYDYMVTSINNWATKLQAKKIVVGIPAFGLRYNSLDANGNNLSWTSYDYAPYVTILGLDATANTKEYISSAKGIYFNGMPLVLQKAAYIKHSGLGGAYLWAGDYDVLDSRSLMATLYKGLN